MNIRTQTVANPDTAEQVRRATGALPAKGIQTDQRAHASRATRLRRGIAMATAVLAGVGAISFGAAAGTAAAEPAPSHAGWDGSVYWFVNEAGDWRYTSHEDIYLERTGGDDGDSGYGDSDSTDSDDPTPDAASDDGIEQGWDGSVYWFKNSSGEWRYTSHEDIYLNRIGEGSDSASDNSSSDSSDSPAARSGDTEAAVEFALAQVGKPFKMGGNGPNSYDCSGLVQQAFLRAGISLPRIADEQYGATTPISSSDLQRGDLLYWSPDGSPGGIQHTAIYLGDNQYVEAAHPGTVVRISHLNSGNWPTQTGRP
ncbi:cell wall-associated NlpC family hydrolase [Kitasatospora sp. MAP12-15]|uniref:C40 family peptidase n=1 Tax=unclassified Kitasatospora TaxID=2633591 RepID=UPI00247407B0|nr:C40 family peptidase [Kitasatospora sp. MAP12-44]MDH6113122.1 cell wall-associated NlpC family hydrolase [Kitasatospora sp. MAP12-44]